MLTWTENDLCINKQRHPVDKLLYQMLSLESIKSQKSTSLRSLLFFANSNSLKPKQLLQPKHFNQNCCQRPVPKEKK